MSTGEDMKMVAMTKKKTLSRPLDAREPVSDYRVGDCRPQDAEERDNRGVPEVGAEREELHRLDEVRPLRSVGDEGRRELAQFLIRLEGGYDHPVERGEVRRPRALRTRACSGVRQRMSPFPPQTTSYVQL